MKKKKGKNLNYFCKPKNRTIFVSQKFNANWLSLRPKYKDLGFLRNWSAALYSFGTLSFLFQRGPNINVNGGILFCKCCAHTRSLPKNGRCTTTTKSQGYVTAPPKTNKYIDFFDKPGAGAVMMQSQIPFSRSAQWSSSLDRATQLKSSLSASSAREEARKRKLSWWRGSFPAEAVWPNKQTN